MCVSVEQEEEIRGEVTVSIESYTPNCARAEEIGDRRRGIFLPLSTGWQLVDDKDDGRRAQHVL